LGLRGATLPASYQAYLDLMRAQPSQIESKTNMIFSAHPLALRAHLSEIALITGLVLSLSACGGGNRSTSTVEGKTTGAGAATSASAAPSASDSAALQAHGAALNTEELGDALAQAKALPADSALVAGQVAPLAAYKSGAVAQKAAAVQLPVYRFYNTQTGTHFYTSSVTERDSVRSNLPFMTYEGMAFYAASQPSAGLKPVYRLFNARFGTHFYTISESERDTLQDQLPDSRLEGIAYYASPVAGMGFKPLYRFFWSRAGSFSGNHFYTASEVERQNLQDNQSATYTYEGVGYYVLTGDCTLVNSTFQQATANACYLANNAAQVSITLPASSDLAVGDTLRVSGLGAGGWRISQNAGQYVQTSLPGAKPLIWETSGPSKSWTSVASSTDGKRLIAAAVQDKLYTSTDAGVSWTARESDRPWRSVASSADGMKLVAAAEQNQIYTSADAGATWIPRESVRDWISVASSADGTRLAAVANTGHIYVSSDSGVNWSPRASFGNWTSVASSADGLRLVAALSNRQIYTSSDAGITWIPRDSDRNWLWVASSADGAKLVAVVYNGQIYTSNNAGASWTARETNHIWRSVASSADGSKIAAVEYGGQIHISQDSGVTWSTQGPSKNWWGVTSSANGDTLVAAPVVPVDPLYISRTSTAPGATGFLQGGSGSAIELKYLGNSVFEVTSSSGDVTASSAPSPCSGGSSEPRDVPSTKC
jgi:hypothetical protein